MTSELLMPQPKHTEAVMLNFAAVQQSAAAILLSYFRNQSVRGYF